MGCASPPGRFLSLNPKLLLKLAPSMVMLLKRPSRPLKLLPLPAWGVKRVKSLIEREMVGRVFKVRLLMFRLLPVLVALRETLTTTPPIFSVVKSASSLKFSPNVKNTSVNTMSFMPGAEMVTVYGPPAFKLEMSYTPPEREFAV